MIVSHRIVAPHYDRPMRALIKRIHQSAVIWSLVATLLRVGANLFVLPLILRKLPPDQLGLWYVFGSIGSLAALLDLGFEPTVARMASYAWGGASRFVAFGFHQEDAERPDLGANLPLLRDLIATLKAYYLYVGLGVLFLLALGGGCWVWIVTENLPTPSSLRWAWVVYAAGCSLNFVSGRWPALLTGVGAVRDAQFVSIVSLLVYYALAVAGLLAGMGLWAMVLSSVGLGFVARSLGQRLFQKVVAFPGGLPMAHFDRKIFSAIWPNAWRTGFVSIGAFMIVQSNTLVCSAFLGLKATASYGISFQVISILFGLCGTWMAVKTPLINQLRVQGRHQDIVPVFVGRMRLTILSYFAGALCVIFLASPTLRLLGSKTTLLPEDQLAVLALIRFLELHHSLYGALVLSENHNPFLKQALITGVAIVICSIILTPYLGVWGLLLSTGLIQACYNNWWPVWRALRGLNLNPRLYFVHNFLRPGAWLKF
jgi:O-antigen/teichoic acid export membrane protein